MRKVSGEIIKHINFTNVIFTLSAVNIVLANGKIFLCHATVYHLCARKTRANTIRGVQRVPRTHPGIVGEWKSSLVRGETNGDRMPKCLHAKNKF